MDAVQRLNGSGLAYGELKIESVPMETWLIRGIHSGHHPHMKESL
jgi:hypothetical protein